MIVCALSLNSLLTPQAVLCPYLPTQCYKEALGKRVTNVFEPEYGLLVRADLRKRFDLGQWALHEDGEDLIVHVFNASPGSDLLQYHGL